MGNKHSKKTNNAHKYDTDVINQLITFGYGIEEICNAIDKVKNKNDINNIIDYIENESQTKLFKISNSDDYQVHTIKNNDIDGIKIREQIEGCVNHEHSHSDKINKSQEAIRTLMAMGFDETLSSIALSMSGYDVHAAIQCLTSNQFIDNNFTSSSDIQCKGDVDQCAQLTELSKIMIKYKEEQKDIDGEHCIYSKYSNDIVKILDSFNHLLSIHDKNDHQFEKVYKLFGGECNALKCDTVKRHYRDPNRIKNEKNDENLDNKLLCIKDFFDKIHCHITHSYDIGSRLTQNQQRQIEEMKDDEKYEKHSLKQNQKAIKLRQILNQKLLKSEEITTNKKYSKSNKFSSNLYQTEIISKSLCNYSYSFPFNYKDQCKYSKQKGYLEWTYSDLYVPAKHKSLKDELINNGISCIGIKSWNIKMEKATYLKDTINGRKSYAKTEKYWQNFQYRLEHPIHFGYMDGSPITEHHLIVLLIYCSFDEFQNTFSATYRKENDNQTLKDIIKIHSNYHYFARYLKESIEVFGTKYVDGIIKRMYHGINEEMTFNELNAFIFGPLSTTYEWNVAVQFSCHTGLVIELVPSIDVKYFECEWLSPFSSEGELLFIGGMDSINFLNITNAESGWDYTEYIKALRIIDTMTKGVYFMNDPADIHKMMHPKKKDLICYDVKSLKLPNIRLWDKKLCLALLYHELNRNGYETEKYKKLPHLNAYTDQLLHQICLNKPKIVIKWLTMNVNILTECDGFAGGYIGYDFLRLLFCGTDYEYQGINLNVFNALFPNLSHIYVVGLAAIDPKFLNHIYEFLQKTNKSDIYFELHISKEYEDSNISIQHSKFKPKFKKMGFNLWCGKLQQGFQTHCIVIEKS